LREKLDNLSSLEALKKALEIEPSNEDILHYFEETKQEFEEDTSIPNDHPEK
jgi:hypothetical protein